MPNKLIVITGPTGSGKSALAMRMAGEIGCDIISADSRQMFREIPIGTAAPTASDRACVTHHFVGNLSLGDYYSAAQYEEEVMRLLPSLWRKSPVQIMCGGSMMYRHGSFTNAVAFSSYASRSSNSTPYTTARSTSTTTSASSTPSRYAVRRVYPTHRFAQGVPSRATSTSKCSPSTCRATSFSTASTAASSQ